MACSGISLAMILLRIPQLDLTTPLLLIQRKKTLKQTKRTLRLITPKPKPKERKLCIVLTVFVADCKMVFVDVDVTSRRSEMFKMKSTCSECPLTYSVAISFDFVQSVKQLGCIRLRNLFFLLFLWKYVPCKLSDHRLPSCFVKCFGLIFFYLYHSHFQKKKGPSKYRVGQHILAQYYRPNLLEITWRLR